MLWHQLQVQGCMALVGSTHDGNVEILLYILHDLRIPRHTYALFLRIPPWDDVICQDWRVFDKMSIVRIPAKVSVGTPGTLLLSSLPLYE